MPRFSYRKEVQKNKEMPKSKPTPSSKSSPDSPSRRSSRRSAPTPSASSSLQRLSDAGDGAKTPASILKSGRYRIQVPRTGKGEDGYADDSPYWEAAKRASTQDSPPDSFESSLSDEGDKIDPKEQKRKEKQKKKREEIAKLKNQYKEGQAKLKPNFNVGTGSQSENSDNEGGGSDQGEWLKTSLQRNGKRAAMFSPSDLSRASTIPPTPASTKKTSTPSSMDSKQQHTPSSSKQQLSIDEGVPEDDDFHISHTDYDSGHEEEEQEKAPLSPIHEEHVVKEARTSQDDNNNMLEDNILDVLGNTNLSDDVGGSSKIGFQQNDDYSVGGDDNDGVGFELADDQHSPQASFSDNEDETKSPKDMTSNRKKSIDPEGSDDNQFNSEARGKRTKKESKRRASIDSEESDDNQSNSESRSNISKKKNSKRRESIDSEESDPKKKAPKKKSRGRPKKVKISAPFGRTGYQVGPREYKTIPAEEFDGNYHDPDGVRRSRRRKFRPLLFWKNEKIMYEANREEGGLAEVFGDMPMVAGVQEAQPTPYKKRTVIQKSDSDDDDEASRKAAKKSKKNSSEIKPYDSKKLRKKHAIDDGDIAPVWWDSQGETLEKSKFFHLTQQFVFAINKLTMHIFPITAEIICYNEKITLHDLPLVKKRSKSEGKIVAKAAQAFNVDPPGDGMPGFICGCMEVPPQGIKDEEGVGPCFQVFNVGECQPKSIELAVADPDINDGNYESESAKRFLLSKGDMFQIPAGNVYRIQNHSKTVACTLNWTIIRPAPKDE